MLRRWVVILWLLATGLAGANVPSAGAFACDAVSNRLSRAVTGGVLTNQTHSFDANDRLSAAGLTYDASGNPRTHGAAAYGYDWADRLVAATNSGNVLTLVYDPDGHRYQRTESGTNTYYLVATVNPTGYPQVVEESGVNGATTNLACRYVYGLDLISQTRGAYATVSHYGYDGLGSVRFLAGSSGSITDTYTYDAYGTLIASTETNINFNRFTGEQWDPDLGMCYLRARYLSPGYGRFWTGDTFEGNNQDPPSLRKYLYCHADPVNRIDPSGHFSLPEFNISTAIGETLQEFRAVPQAVIKRSIRDYAKNVAEAFDFRDKHENVQIAQAAERLWTMRLQLHGFKVVNLKGIGQHGPDLVAFGKSGGRYHLIVGEVKGTRRARVMSLLDELEDRTIQMSAHWIQMGLESIVDGVMGVLPDLSQYAGGRLNALLDRGEFDLYLLRARDMRNNSWVLTGYPLLQVNLPGGGGQGKGVKRGETGDIRDLETPKTFQFPSVP